MNIKDDKLLKLLSSKVEPKISIILPIHPETPQIEENILTYKNLLKDVKKDLELNYPRRQWENTVEQLDSLLLDRQLFSTSKRALIVFANNETMEICEMNHKVSPKAHVGTTFLVQDLLLPVENIDKPDYIVNTSRDRINVFDIDSLKEIKLHQIHHKFSDYYSDFDAESNVNSGSYGGKNIAQYHGHRSKPEEQERDQEIYYRYLDKAFSSYYRENGETYLLTGLPEVLDVYLNSYGNSPYIGGVIHSSILNLSHQELNEKINEYKYFEDIAMMEKTKHELHKALNQEKLIQDLNTIGFALDNHDVRTLVLVNDGKSYSIDHNKILVQSILNQTNCQVIYDEEESAPSINAIVY